MTCILTDEELQQIAMQSIVPMSAWQSIANAAARKALEMAVRECDGQRRELKSFSTVLAYNDAVTDCADAIRELSGRFE